MAISNLQDDLPLRGICLQHQDKIEKFAQNDHQPNTVPYSNLLHHANNPRPVSTLLGLMGRVQKTLNNKHADKTNLPLDAKKCNTKQYDKAIPYDVGIV